MRQTFIFLAAAAALSATSTAALAHASLERSEAPAGSYKAGDQVPHTRIDIPEDPHALERPAPAVTIVASEGGHGEHAAAASAEVKVSSLTVSGGWLKAMLPGQPAGGGYLTVVNDGAEADRLVAVSTPAAGKAEIHEMKVVDDVMVMRPVEGGIEIPAGGKVDLKPGGLHLMFMQVSEPFTEGATVPVTLQFEKAGAVELSLPVRRAAGSNHDH